MERKRAASVSFTNSIELGDPPTRHAPHPVAGHLLEPATRKLWTVPTPLSLRLGRAMRFERRAAPLRSSCQFAPVFENVQIPEGAVNEHDRLTLAALKVMERGLVDLDRLNLGAAWSALSSCVPGCRFSAGRDPRFSKPCPPDLSTRLTASVRRQGVLSDEVARRESLAVTRRVQKARLDPTMHLDAWDRPAAADLDAASSAGARA